MDQDFQDRAQKVRLLVMDVDGVLTSGNIYYDHEGEEIKCFHVHDGMGIKRWHDAGFMSAIISGRQSKALERRAEELNISHLFQAKDSTIEHFKALLNELELSAEQVAYIGDDLPDLPCLEAAGLAISVPNAVEEVKAISDYVTKKEGGSGAVRELIELLLNAKQ